MKTNFTGTINQGECVGILYLYCIILILFIIRWSKEFIWDRECLTGNSVIKYGRGAVL